jgi:hypothetical protein
LIVIGTATRAQSKDLKAAFDLKKDRQCRRRQAKRLPGKTVSCARLFGFLALGRKLRFLAQTFRRPFHHPMEQCFRAVQKLRSSPLESDNFHVIRKIKIS